LAKLSVEQALAKAKSHTKKGELAEAQVLYATILKSFPNNKKAQQGLTALGGGQGPAVERVPPRAIIDQLINLYNQGKLEVVVEQAQNLTAQYPKSVALWNLMGAAAAQIGQLDRAIFAFQGVLAIKPDTPEAYSNMGIALADQGKLEAAIEAYYKALAIQPDYAEAYSNMGIALKDQGKLEEAIEACSKAISIKPDYAEAYSNMGIALKEQGKLEEAIEAYYKALAIKPDYAVAYSNMGIALKGVKFKKPNQGLQKTIGLLLDQKNSVRPSDIARATISLLKFETNLQKHLAEPTVGKTEQSLQQTVLELSDIQLLLKLMSICPLADSGLETLLKELRAGILLALPSFESTPDILEFQSALALQCFTNEYIYDQSEDEEKALKILEFSVEASLSRGEQPSPQAILCLATYKALYDYRWSELLSDNDDIHEVFIRQVSEPRLECQIKSNMPMLQKITDDVSVKVRAQYEKNPYPRWVNLGLPLNSESISKVVSQSKIKLFDSEICQVNSPDILIAGCGTGQHSIGTAARFRNSKVLAIDLSLSSLSYAKRKTEELGITDIEYMQADILKLEQLDRQFNIIESVGVLHHMDNPMAGWKVLTNCLKDGGLMKIGLYSELARQHIKKIRHEISQSDIDSSDLAMKSFRADVMTSDLEHHNRIVNSPDFYSLSTFRDLLFHVQEHRFTIPQLIKCLEELDLKFCGFETASIVQKFKQSNIRPNDPYDLDAWQRYEEDNPRTFAVMYHFWCQKVA
jgi:tetratricopeptide (TPR) repeat protein/2-polyprenyl-3-methyl-5-hydroxy-6-metoxy-1,4-benzoquinol methylase